ncbi:unnamed protein product, partial [Mesorhabditis spiculigera]
MGFLHDFFVFLLTRIWAGMRLYYQWSNILTPITIAVCCVLFAIWKIVGSCHAPYEALKKHLEYRKTLTKMKKILEKEYTDDEWGDAKFCSAYLKFHGKYLKFLDVARRGPDGLLNRDSPYDDFIEIKIWEPAPTVINPVKDTI